MAKRKIELFLEINNEWEFDYILTRNMNRLVCAEVYCSFSGSCTALDRLFTKIKLDWSDGQMILLKVLADEIEVLKRFRDQSKPIFIFITEMKITRVFRGVDAVNFAEVAKEELYYYKKKQEGETFERPTYELNEPSPEEVEWQRALTTEAEDEAARTQALRSKRQAARKKHRAELMAPHLQHLNFVLFWPHAKHAHPELYERWDMNNIIMVGREEIQLTRDIALDILYAGDAIINDASLHELLNGPALAICFRLLDTDKHFVSLVRHILYEDIPAMADTKTLNEQHPQKTAFDFYKSYSPTREEVLRKRHEEKERRKEEEKEKRARRLSEMQRLTRQAIEESIKAKKKQKETRALELLKLGNLAAFERLRQESEEDYVEDIVVSENLSDEYEDQRSEKDGPDEYFPPAGLLVPGFYTPPNDIAKANGLAILFPTLVLEHVTPQPEFLPPHVLVMFQIQKRHKVVDVIHKHKSSILHIGIFKLKTPYDAIHIAFSVKQYDSIENIAWNLDDVNLAVMLSIETDLPLLDLMDLNPSHVSRDHRTGEDECAAMFPVNYGDGYSEFEDF